MKARKVAVLPSATIALRDRLIARTVIPAVLAEMHGAECLEAILETTEALTNEHPFTEEGTELRERLQALLWNLGFSPFVPDPEAWAWVEGRGVICRTAPDYPALNAGFEDDDDPDV